MGRGALEFWLKLDEIILAGAQHARTNFGEIFRAEI